MKEIQRILVKYNKPVEIGVFSKDHNLYGIWASDLISVEHDIVEFIRKEIVRARIDEVKRVWFNDLKDMVMSGNEALTISQRIAQLEGLIE